jgi:hypothetical protein
VTVVQENESGAVFTRSIRAALGRVPLWLLVTLAVGLLALPGAVLTYDTFQDALGRGYEPGSQFRSLGTSFHVDSADERAALDAAVGSTGAVLAALAVLLGIFTAGGWLQVFLERTDGHSVRRFFHGGVRHFWRFFRVFLLVLVGAAVVQWAVFEGPWHDLVETRLLGLPEVPPQGAAVGAEYTELRLQELTDERTAVRVTWLQDGLHAVAMAVLLTWAVFTRARLALHDARSSLWAGLCTFFMMLRHPLKTLRPMLLLLLVEAAVVFAAGGVHRWIEDGLDASSTWRSVAVIFVVSSAVLAVSEILHAARYHAAIVVSRRVIAPIPRPDPWKHSIGAPGGPQYPIIEGGDEYGVSL